MNNSSIVTKYGICEECGDGKLKPVIAGRCRAYHYKRNRAKVFLAKRHQEKSFEDYVAEQMLDDWFLDIGERIITPNPFCWECGAKIFIDNDQPLHVYRSNTAHIFPKSIFHSVETHMLNFIIAGSACGCHNKTHRLDTFSKMKIWPMAVQRFHSFQSEITETHKYLYFFIKYSKT